MEYGRTNLPNDPENFILTQIMCNPGRNVQDIIDHVKRFPNVLTHATHCAVLVRGNDVSQGIHPETIHDKIQELHGYLHSLNPWMQLVDICITPRFNSKDQCSASQQPQDQTPKTQPHSGLFQTQHRPHRQVFYHEG